MTDRLTNGQITCLPIFKYGTLHQVVSMLSYFLSFYEHVRISLILRIHFYGNLICCLELKMFIVCDLSCSDGMKAAHPGS